MACAGLCLSGMPVIMSMSVHHVHVFPKQPGSSSEAQLQRTHAELSEARSAVGRLQASVSADGALSADLRARLATTARKRGEKGRKEGQRRRPPAGVASRGKYAVCRVERQAGHSRCGQREKTAQLSGWAGQVEDSVIGKVGRGMGTARLDGPVNPLPDAGATLIKHPSTQPSTSAHITSHLPPLAEEQPKSEHAARFGTSVRLSNAGLQLRCSTHLHASTPNPCRIVSGERACCALQSAVAAVQHRAPFHRAFAPFAVCVGPAHSNVYLEQRGLARTLQADAIPAQRCGGGLVRSGSGFTTRLKEQPFSIEVQWTPWYGGARLSLADVRAKDPATPAWHRVQGRTCGRKSWEHSQRANAVWVRKAASERRSAFPVDYRQMDFCVDDPFT
eukprot:350270-Chlamydomonas_euryale.AAC.1